MVCWDVIMPPGVMVLFLTTEDCLRIGWDRSFESQGSRGPLNSFKANIRSPLLEVPAAVAASPRIKFCLPSKYWVFFQKLSKI